MANSFTLAQSPPDPLKHGVGQPLQAEHADGGAVQDLLLASNWCAAWGGTGSLVSQGWGNSMATKTAVLPALGTYHGLWRIPRLGPGYGTVSVGVWAEFTGIAPAVGQVRFEGLESGTSVVVDVSAGAAALYTGTLTIQQVAGEETILFALAGDGTDACIVHEVFVEGVPLTSPLAVGVIGGASGTVIPFDADECDPDSVLSADQGAHLIGNMADFFARQRVIYQWTALQGIDDYMPNREHRGWFPVHPDSAEQNLELEVRVNATGGASDSVIYISLGGRPGRYGTSRDTIAIPVGAGAARDWYSETIRVREHSLLRGVPHPFSHVTVFPSEEGCRPYVDAGGDTVGGEPWRFVGSGDNAQNRGDPSPEIHAVSIWTV